MLVRARLFMVTSRGTCVAILSRASVAGPAKAGMLPHTTHVGVARVTILARRTDRTVGARLPRGRARPCCAGLSPRLQPTGQNFRSQLFGRPVARVRLRRTNLLEEPPHPVPPRPGPEQLPIMSVRRRSNSLSVMVMMSPIVRITSTAAAIRSSSVTVLVSVAIASSFGVPIATHPHEAARPDIVTGSPVPKSGTSTAHPPGMWSRSSGFRNLASSMCRSASSAYARDSTRCSSVPRWSSCQT
jgi:hypothetical protein